MTPRRYDLPRCRRPKITGQLLLLGMTLNAVFWIYWVGKVAAFVNPLSVGPFVTRETIFPEQMDDLILMILIWVNWISLMFIGLQLLFGCIALCSGFRKLQRRSNWIYIICDILVGLQLLIVIIAVTVLDVQASPPVSNEPIPWRVSASIANAILYVGCLCWLTVLMFRRPQEYREIL
jgi:hypothetical protein